MNKLEFERECWTQQSHCDCDANVIIIFLTLLSVHIYSNSFLIINKSRSSTPRPLA